MGPGNRRPRNSEASSSGRGGQVRWCSRRDLPVRWCTLSRVGGGGLPWAVAAGTPGNDFRERWCPAATRCGEGSGASDPCGGVPAAAGAPPGGPATGQPGCGPVGVAPPSGPAGRLDNRPPPPGGGGHNGQTPCGGAPRNPRRTVQAAAVWAGGWCALMHRPAGVRARVATRANGPATGLRDPGAPRPARARCARGHGAEGGVSRASQDGTPVRRPARSLPLAGSATVPAAAPAVPDNAAGRRRVRRRFRLPIGPVPTGGRAGRQPAAEHRGRPSQVLLRLLPGSPGPRPGTLAGLRERRAWNPPPEETAGGVPRFGPGACGSAPWWPACGEGGRY